MEKLNHSPTKICLSLLLGFVGCLQAQVLESQSLLPALPAASVPAVCKFVPSELIPCEVVVQHYYHYLMSLLQQPNSKAFYKNMLSF